MVREDLARGPRPDCVVLRWDNFIIYGFYTFPFAVVWKESNLFKYVNKTKCPCPTLMLTPGGQYKRSQHWTAAVPRLLHKPGWWSDTRIFRGLWTKVFWSMSVLGKERSGRLCLRIKVRPCPCPSQPQYNVHDYLLMYDSPISHLMLIYLNRLHAAAMTLASTLWAKYIQMCRVTAAYTRFPWSMFYQL